MNWSSFGTSLRNLGRRRYRDRLTLGLLAVSLPIAIALVLVLTQIASSNLRSSTEGFLADRAQGLSTILDRLLAERQGDMAVVASLLSGKLESPSSPRLLAQVVEASDDYDIIEVAGLSGGALFGSSEQTFDASDQEWFRCAAGGDPAISPIYREFDNLRWVVAHPVIGTDGSPEAVLLGDLNVGSLAPFISADFGQTAEIVLVDPEQRVVISSDSGAEPTESELIEVGSLETTLASDAAAESVEGSSGSTDFVDEDGNTVLAGYAPFSAAGWGVIAKQDRGEALQSVTNQRQLGSSLVLLAGLLLATFAFLFARREARHLSHLADQSTAASEEVTEKSAELSSASEELAATTTEQSAAVTETSATMEELARAAASIAETVDAVAMQTSETREFLEKAGSDIQNSSERTLALAERVNDISAILGLINEIADQTNLLALNAAIEAARAGEGGRGFAVVADEVRRLAERSKNSAADIGKILEDVQTETNATVMAMEKGAKQMTRSLDLWDQITEGAAQVSLTTQQQRSATEQVVGTIEQLTQASQQVSSTAQEIASASATLATLASNLQQTAGAAKDRF